MPWGGRSERVALLATVGGDHHVVSAPVASAEVTAGRNLAAEPRDTLTWDDVALPDDAVGVAPAGVDASALRLRGALGRAALISGALARVSELTVRYTGERHQFGRPIARFQAVQTHLVTIAEEAQLAGLATQVAALNARPEPVFFDVAAAKAAASEAATIAARASHQAHGAIGMTKEYELGQLTRRLWSWRDEFGSERYWSRELGRQLAEAGADELWPRISTGLGSAMSTELGRRRRRRRRRRADGGAGGRGGRAAGDRLRPPLAGRSAGQPDHAARLPGAGRVRGVLGADLRAGGRGPRRPASR